MTFRIDIDVEIEASPDQVWAVLMDTDSYKEWNPFVEDCETTYTPGDPIKLRVNLVGPTFTQVEYMKAFDADARTFSYNMKPMPAGALSSERSHEVVDAGNGKSIYKSRFQLQGWMMPLVRGMMKGALEKGFRGMTHGVKARAESLAG